MTTGRRLARILAFQTLFELEARTGTDVDDTLARRAATLEEDTGEVVRPGALKFATRLVSGTLERRPDIDARIAPAAPAFPVSQMSTTDRVALELAVYELVYERDAPVKVVINEAVELAKRFGAENSGRFVNGVLGTIAGELGADEAGRTAPAQEPNRTTEQ
ncbi:MAG: transcription antitermination factor NusB [Chloroflexi bacterium]|nr:transcription antitermination factor NusB [Chloroflexota bacterium]